MTIEEVVPFLVRHPDSPPGAVHAVEAELARTPEGAVATFRIAGDTHEVVVPRPAAGRANELWRTTCFELFIERKQGGYREFNLSPSGAWAAYDFDGYREGMRDADADVAISFSNEGNRLTMIAAIDSEFPDYARVGLSAVVEEADGAVRYWATSFAPGKPDFHHESVRSLILDTVSAA
jgi:hypothetical protein